LAHRADSLIPPRRIGLHLALLGLVILELLWLRWFLVEPLPNAANAGGQVNRWLFLCRALPHVVPGVRLSESYLGLALHELRHVENLPQRLPIALAAGLVAGAALALGEGLLRLLRVRDRLRWVERLPLAYGLGTTSLGLITLIVGRLGGLTPYRVRLGLGVLLILGLVDLIRRAFKPAAQCPTPPLVAEPGTPSWRTAWIGFGLVVVAPFLILMTLGAMLPSIDFDAIEYHLQGPKEYYLSGQIRFLTHNVYTSMPFNVEMLHLLCMEVLDDWWKGALAGQLLIALYALAAGWMVALTATRLASVRAGVMAAVVYLTTPWIFRLGVISYVEGPLCYYHAALVWMAVVAWPVTEPALRNRLWGILGALAGGAMACKYPGLISAVIPFGVLAVVVAWKRSAWSVVATFALGCAIVMTPWLGKNLIDTGNPVYPLGYRVFGGSHWDLAREAKWNNAHGTKAVTWPDFQQAVVDVAGRSDWQSPLYVALTPLAFFRRGTRRGTLALWGLVLYLFLTWWFLTHRLDRFWLPLLAPWAVLAGLGADWVRSRGWSVLLGALLFLAVTTNLSYTSSALTGFNEWTNDLNHLRRSVPEFLNPPLASLDQQLPPDARPLLVGQAAVFHLQHQVIYNTVFDNENIELLTRDRSAEEVRSALAKRGITHVYVDWFEIERYRSPGNYGFTSYVTPELFDRLVKLEVLGPPVPLGGRQDLYPVLGASPRR